MKVGVVSDVHNNAVALRYALDRLRGCELVISLGDLVSQYRATPEIMDLARDAGLLGIAGNHEKAILAPCGFPLRSKLTPDDLAYLEGLPTQLELELDGRALLAVHGSPWDDPNSMSCVYVHEADREALSRLQAVPADIVLLGHTHVAMAVRLGNKLVLNPGSCGEPRDRLGRLSFGELDFDAGVATVYEIRNGSPPAVMLQAAC
jgi:putative phosphoesterase